MVESLHPSQLHARVIERKRALHQQEVGKENDKKMDKKKEEEEDKEKEEEEEEEEEEK